MRFRVVLLMAILLSSCGGDEVRSTEDPPARTDLLTYDFDPEAGYPTGGTSGTLQIDGACVTLAVGSESQLLIWPSGFRRDGDQIFDGEDRLFGSAGDAIDVFGGETFGGSDLEIEGDIPECGHAGFWVVLPPGF
jgi:hypothetical protein